MASNSLSYCKKRYNMSQLDLDFGTQDFVDAPIAQRIKNFVAMYPELNIVKVVHYNDNKYFVCICEIDGVDCFVLDGDQDTVTKDSFKLRVTVSDQTWVKRRVRYFNFGEEIVRDSNQQYNGMTAVREPVLGALVELTNNTDSSVLITTEVFANHTFTSHYTIHPGQTWKDNKGGIVRSVRLLIEVECSTKQLELL
jgi:hypothetical protein